MEPGRLGRLLEPDHSASCRRMDAIAWQVVLLNEHMSGLGDFIGGGVGFESDRCGLCDGVAAPDAYLTLRPSGFERPLRGAVGGGDAELNEEGARMEWLSP